MLIHSLEPILQQHVTKIKNLSGCEVKLLDRENLVANASECSKVEILICRDRDNIPRVIELCPQLKFLYVVSTGVEKLPFSALLEHDVRVANTGGVNAGIMSEYAMAYILSQSARVCENLDNQRKHYWKKFQCVDTLSGRNLLIVGAGHAGKLLAHKAKTFGMNVVGIKKHPESLTYFDDVVSLSEMEQYLTWADFVVCTIPLTNSTEGLFNRRMFSLMKSSCVFINLSRGGLVVQQELVEALNNSVIGAAILDVYETEPILPDSMLWDTPNLYMSPHSAGRMDDFIDKAIDCFIVNLNAFLMGEMMPNEVRLDEGY